METATHPGAWLRYSAPSAGHVGVMAYDITTGDCGELGMAGEPTSRPAGVETMWLLHAVPATLKSWLTGEVAL